MTDTHEGSGQWLREVRSETAGKVRVHLSCEHLVTFPVEVFVGGHPGFVGPDMLGISDSLARDLIDFQTWWQAHTSFSGDEDGSESPAERVEWAKWHDSGEILLHRLQQELGEDYEVAWV